MIFLDVLSPLGKSLICIFELPAASVARNVARAHCEGSRVCAKVTALKADDQNDKLQGG